MQINKDIDKGGGVQLFYFHVPSISVLLFLFYFLLFSPILKSISLSLFPPPPLPPSTWWGGGGGGTCPHNYYYP